MAFDNIRRDPEGKHFQPDQGKKGRRKGVILGDGFKALEAQAQKLTPRKR